MDIFFEKSENFEFGKIEKLPEETVVLRKKRFNLLECIFVKIGGQNYTGGSRPSCS